MVLFYLFIFFLSNSNFELAVANQLSIIISEMNGIPFLTLALFHVFAIFSVVLIWREKTIGLYFYSIITILMPMYLSLYLSFNELLNIYVFSIICVLLFLFKIKEIKNKDLLLKTNDEIIDL